MITYFYVIYCGFNKRRKVKDKKAFPNDFAWRQMLWCCGCLFLRSAKLHLQQQRKIFIQGVPGKMCLFFTNILHQLTFRPIVIAALVVKKIQFQLPTNITSVQSSDKWRPLVGLCYGKMRDCTNIFRKKTHIFEHPACTYIKQKKATLTVSTSYVCMCVFL